MGAFEDKYVYTYKLQPIFWYRFIDDIIFAWPHGEDSPLEFISYLNNDCDRNIHFTYDYSYSEVTFLDTRLYFDEKHKLAATLYVKPTDSHNYLLLIYNSAHHQHSSLIFF